MGGTEIFFLVVLGVIIFGPEKLPDLARKAARVVNYLRGVANNARQTLSEELGPEFSEMDLRDFHPRTFVAKHLLSDEQQMVKDLRTVADEVASPLSPTASVPRASAPAQPRPRPTPPFDTEAT